jgi:hypothetical protein
MSMKAVTVGASLHESDPRRLQDRELPIPTPSSHDLLAAVAAVAVNPVDLKVRDATGADSPAPRVLGWDASGVVRAVGAEVSLFRVGDAVFYAGEITRPGSNAEFQLVDERLAGRKPRSLSFAEAAALPLTTITAFESLFHRLRIPRDGSARGQTILLIGAAGGVGSIAIQLASRAGLTVIATASRASSIAWVQELGAKVALARRLGLIDTPVERALSALRKLRNAFAHSAESASLADPVHSSRLTEVYELARANPLWAPLETVLAAQPPTDRGPLDQALRDYILLITILVAFLEATAQQLKPIQPAVVMGLGGISPAIRSGISNEAAAGDS